MTFTFRGSTDIYSNVLSSSKSTAVTYIAFKQTLISMQSTGRVILKWAGKVLNRRRLQNAIPKTKMLCNLTLSESEVEAAME